VRGETITFDGHRLNDRFFVGEVAVGMPEYAPRIEDREFADGSRVRGMRLGSPEVSVQLVAKPIYGRAARETLSELVSWLHVDGPKQLSLSSDGGLWRMCVPIGAPQIGDNEWNDRVTVTFRQVEPALYGERHEVTVPSGAAITFVVGGDYPTLPSISTDDATRDSTTRQWGVRLDDGNVMRVTIPVSVTSTVEMDCLWRTCLVNGATTTPTLLSDWFVLEPGAHVVRNDMGAGDCTLSWYERWHR